MRVFTKLFDHG